MPIETVDNITSARSRTLGKGRNAQRSAAYVVYDTLLTTVFVL